MRSGSAQNQNPLFLQSGKPRPSGGRTTKEKDKMAISYTAGNPNAGGVAKAMAPGVYPLVITKADQKTSKAGNPMIALKFGVLKKDGSTSGAVYENLVFSESCFWKVDQLLVASGNHPGEGEPIELEAAEMVGWEVFAELGVEKDQKGKDRNVVVEFLDAKAGAARLKEQAAKKAAAAKAKAAAEADEEFA